jgi:hypothetical protein
VEYVPQESRTRDGHLLEPEAIVTSLDDAHRASGHAALVRDGLGIVATQRPRARRADHIAAGAVLICRDWHGLSA